MQVVLVMFRNDGERRSFSVVRNMTVIGRREDCDLRIPVGDVSRKHCRLVRTDDGIRIEDLGSSNGTIVNGERVQESDLHAGDVVGIGPVQFIVQIDGVPDEEEMVAPGTAANRDESSMMGEPIPTEELVPDELVPEEELHAAEDSGEFQIEDQHTASETATIDEDEMVFDEHTDNAAAVEPLEELSLEESPLEELPAEELTADELSEDEFSLEELPSEEPVAAEPLAELEEDPLGLEEIAEETPAVAGGSAEVPLETELSPEDELSLEELPAEGLSDETAIAPVEGIGEDAGEDELGLEEFALEEIGDETPEHPASAATAVTPPAPPAPIAPVALEDPLELEELDEEHPAEPQAVEEPLDELEMDELGMEELGMEELEFSEPAGAAPAPAVAHVDPASILPAEPVEEIEPVNLDDEVSHDGVPHTEETEPVELEASEESAWDFVIEEPEGDRSHHDFKIDLDSPSHP